MIGQNRSIAQRHPMDFQQSAHRPSVFGCNHIGAGQNVQRAQSDVSGSPDGCGDKVQP